MMCIAFSPIEISVRPTAGSAPTTHLHNLPKGSKIGKYYTACGYMPCITMSVGSSQFTSQGQDIISCPPAAATRGLGGCTDTQCHRQSPKGQRIRRCSHWAFRNSVSMPLSCVKPHSSVSDCFQVITAEDAQIVCDAVRSWHPSTTKTMQRYQYVTHTSAKPD